MKLSHLSLLLLFSSCLLCTLAEDYYQILGVPRNADDHALKKAFKKLTLKYHPDKNRENPDWAREQYVKVSHAYEVLIDPEKRRIYNVEGEEGVQKQEQMKGQPGMHQDIYGRFFHTGFQDDLWVQSDVFQLSIKEISGFYRREQVWIIYFYNPERQESRQHKDLIRDLAFKLYGIIKVASVNCQEDREDALCEELGAYSTPRIIVFPANIAAEGIQYEGPMTYQAISNFAANQMENFVRFVNDENYNSFASEEPEKNKVLLFTSRKSTPPVLKALSKEFKGRLIIGEVRQTSKGLIEKFGISSFPTVLVVTDPSGYKGIKYEGEFKKDHLYRFLREYAYISKPKATTIGNAQLAELTEKGIEVGRCGESDEKLCFLYLSKSRKDEKDLIQAIGSLANNYANDPINFYIIDAQRISYSDVFNDVTEVPAIVVIKGKRKRYVKFEGDFEAEKIKDFVDFVVSGSATFSKLKQYLDWITLSSEL